MRNLIFFVPVLAMITAIYLFKKNGKREFLSFDLVQFFYAFILTPTIFIWSKSVLFVLLREQLDLALSQTELFIIDSGFSLIFLYVFAFVVIHSLTKTFSLRRTSEPLYDIFKHSEFFHHDFSHLIIYAGVMLMAVFMSTVNVLVPFDMPHSEIFFNIVLAVGVLSGALSFAGIWLFESKDPNFMRIIKLLAGVSFLIHVVWYFIFDPTFTLDFGLYWITFTLFFTAVLLSLFAERKEKPQGFLQQIPFTINPLKINYYFIYLRNILKKYISI